MTKLVILEDNLKNKDDLEPWDTVGGLMDVGGVVSKVCMYWIISQVDVVS